MENFIPFSNKRKRNIYPAMLQIIIAFFLSISLIVGMDLHSIPTAIAAPIAPHPNTEIVLGINYDGTEPWVADPTYTANIDGQHTPGADDNANNFVVRTFDIVQYRIDWNVNEVDGTKEWELNKLCI